jgi:hypothetical protein
MKLRIEVQIAAPTQTLLLRVVVKAYDTEIRLMMLEGAFMHIPGANPTVWIDLGIQQVFGDTRFMYLMPNGVMRKLGIASDEELIDFIGKTYKSMVPDDLPTWQDIIPNANALIKVEPQTKPLPSGWTSDT